MSGSERSWQHPTIYAAHVVAALGSQDMVALFKAGFPEEVPLDKPAMILVDGLLREVGFVSTDVAGVPEFGGIFDRRSLKGPGSKRSPKLKMSSRNSRSSPIMPAFDPAVVSQLSGCYSSCSSTSATPWG